MPTWMGDMSQVPTRRWRATNNQWLLREGESVFSWDEPPDRLSNPKWSAPNKYT